ncbi:MAG: hypothetical protein D6732_15070 [Methanobacteriota archaeon]|nr:MAG: hypothetical protein D6732_15070 [Euryarchaeota archaeon]
MSFPQLPSKYQEETFVLHESIMPKKVQKALEGKSKLVIVFDRGLASFIEKRFKGKEVDGSFGRLSILRRTKEVMLVSSIGIGAPALAATIEYYRRGGIEKFLTIGTAGILPETPYGIGEIFIPAQSVRDEGTSHHYLKPGSLVDIPQKTLYFRSKAALEDAGSIVIENINLSTDAPFRLTEKELNYFRMLKVSTVDMELSTLYALGHFYDLEVCGILVGSDITLSDGTSESFPALVRERLEWVAEQLISNE